MPTSTRVSKICCALVSLYFQLVLALASTPGVLWLDFDMKNIPEPKERSSGLYDYFFKGQLIEVTKQDLDVVRWRRHAAGHPKQASNVNALDEVPNSSWYTNRHHLHTMTEKELARGPNQGNGPDFTRVTITKAKPSGVNPGFMVKDAAGQAYLVKFDGFNYPRLQSGAEVISTKILFAAGYNVPENYVAYFDRDALKIGEGVEITDRKTGLKRALNQDDIDVILRRVARMPDGRYRVMASKILAGKPKGPFPQIGFRADDPNDLIPHEDRRELRALRVIASWINDWDLKEAQSLDMYVEENGRKFLRHYLLDFGSSLGADTVPTEYYHGREYGLDLKSIFKEMFSLGAYESADEKHGVMISSEVGMFTAHDFDPGKWHPTYPAVVFNNLTNQDAYWATRIILSFSERDIRAIVRTGEYSDPNDAEYIVQTLIERQNIIARYWLARVDALSDFAIRPSTDGAALTFRDLHVDRKIAAEIPPAYTYQIKGRQYKSRTLTVNGPRIELDRDELSAAVEHDPDHSPIEMTIWPKRENSASEPVRVYFEWSSSRGPLSIRRISRS